jgi:carbamoyltransferase
MRSILGLSAFYHDAAAALVVDGRIVAAAQEERFTRVKHDARFPRQAVGWCLREAGLRLEDLDLVAFHEKPLLKLDRLLETHAALAPASLPAFVRAMPSWLTWKARMTRELARGLDGRYTRRFVLPEHHLSHAASAFLPSPFREAAILTLDGVGEWTTASVGVGEGNRVRLLEDLRFPHSLGLLYSAFTVLCGFAVNDGEYKLMGLAPYGEPRFKDLILERLVDLKPDGSFHLDMRWFSWAHGRSMTAPRLHRLLGRGPRRPDAPLEQLDKDLAASVQAVTEEVMLRAARHALARTGKRDLCLAGGVALNCVGNGRIARESGARAVWVQPAAGDAGGALGAALWAWHGLLGMPREPGDGDAMRGARLGPAFSPEAARAALERVGARYERLADPAARAERVAGLLADGKVVGWFEGALEYGPRALGGRSILADPRDPGMQSRVNLMVKFRESFRPFAPAVTAERAAEWFELAPGVESPYMLLTTQVAASRRGRIPAVTHVDGSARVQTVDAARAPALHALLRAFERRTGCPVLVNTSFNVKDEPIVATPEDAWRCFLATKIDALLLEDCLVTEKPSAAAPPISGGRRTTGDAVEGAAAHDAAPAPTRAALLAFCFVPLVLLGVLAAFAAWRWHAPVVGAALGATGALGTALLLALPRARRPAWAGWMRLARPLGRLVGALLLSLTYLLVLTPLALARRLVGADPLAWKSRRDATTCWRERPESRDVEDAFRPY